jgi:hypothetical protein
VDIAVVDAGVNLKAHVITMDGAFIGSINIPIKKLTLPSLFRMRPKTLHRWPSLVRSCSASVMLLADGSSFSLGRSTGLCYKAVRGGEREPGSAIREARMAGQTLEAWIGREVSLHLWKSDDLGTEPLAAVLRGVDSFGVTVEDLQQPHLTFYPWSTVREILLRQDQGNG